MKRKFEEGLHNPEEKCAKSGFLTEVKAYIVPTGIGKTRCDLFKRQLINNGGEACTEYIPGHVTHVVIDEKIDVERLCRIMEWESPPNPANCKIVRSLWLSHCLRDKHLIDPSSYELDASRYTKNRDVTTSKDTVQLDAQHNPSAGGRLDVANDGQPSTSSVKSDKNFKRSDSLDQKKITSPDQDTDVESDYVPSGDEEGATTSRGDSEQLTASPSGKSLPVCIVV